jgi:uncharacterized NAD(P)/FAD-binding protein YdhS
MAGLSVAVVGGGCAGVLVARELLRCTSGDVLLIEPGRPGGGLAYGAARPWHLLNSRAGAMSADPDHPGHFVRWANARGIPAAAEDFLSRRDYGEYLRETFAETVAAYPGRLRVLSAAATAVRSDGSGCSVTLTPAARVRVDHVVLATGSPAGQQPSAVPAPLRGHPGYAGDPWREGALDAIPNDAPVLLIGAGLTAVDVALTLTAGGRRLTVAGRGRTADGRPAPIVAVSRRGHLPLAHTVAAAPPTIPALGDRATLRDVVRAVRASAAEAGDWRAVVDGLRPRLDELWAAFTDAEQEAFLRHLARYWECHRHRMAPSVAARIADLRSEGQFEVRAGGVRSVAAAGDGLMVTYGDGERRRFEAVVNCAGPGRLPEAAGPLVGGLLDAGLARVGRHRLGLDVDAAGRLIGADGTAQPRVWLIGALRRGAQWETTAVPEIRGQARRLATDLAAADQEAAALPAAA